MNDTNEKMIVNGEKFIKLYCDRNCVGDCSDSVKDACAFMHLIKDSTVNHLCIDADDWETIDELIEYWKSSLPPKVDYADLVGAEAWARGHRYVYEDEYGYMIENTIKIFEKIKENKDILCI